MRAPDRLTRLALGLRRHRTGVDDDRLGERGRMVAHHLALIGVQTAAEGQHLNGHAGYAARSMVPVKAIATGPVISTLPLSSHSIASSPPSTCTMAERPVRPRRCALTSAAHAPEPH